MAELRDGMSGEMTLASASFTLSDIRAELSSGVFPPGWIAEKHWDGCTARRYIRSLIKAEMSAPTTEDRLRDFVASHSERLDNESPDPNDEMACGQNYGAAEMVSLLADEFGIQLS